MGAPLILKRQNIITAKFTRKDIQTSSPWVQTNLTLENANRLGENLSLVDGKIKIGKNVSKILVSANCMGVQLKSSDKSLTIRKGNTSLASTYLSGSLGDGFVSVGIAPVLAYVSENEFIGIEVASQYAETLNIMETTLTVEVVE